MKEYIFSIAFLCIAGFSFAQPKPTELDKSPMDMSYLPAYYPLLKMDGKIKEAPTARLIYSRPQKKGRAIFDSLVKYKEIWRLGANEATEIEFFKTVIIAGTKVQKGRYTIYCIPDQTKWTIILNKDNYSWGNYTYDIKKDVLRTDIPVTKSSEVVDPLTMYFENTKTTANLVMLWDDVKVSLPISL